MSKDEDYWEDKTSGLTEKEAIKGGNQAFWIDLGNSLYLKEKLIIILAGEVFKGFWLYLYIIGKINDFVWSFVSFFNLLIK